MGKRVPRGQQTREHILAAALREFAARGYQEVTIEDIAAAADVTKGAVYYWFTDKDDVGRELQHALYERLTQNALRNLDTGTDLVTTMVRGFHAYLEALTDLGEARFFLRDAWVIPALDAAGRRDHEDSVALVTGILAAGMERGEIVDLDPETLAHVLVGAWAEATLHVLRTGRRDEATAVVRHIVESLQAEPENAARGLETPRTRRGRRT